MSALDIRLAAEALRSRAASTFNGSYQTLGAVLAHPIRLFKITNDTNVGVTISYNGGTTDHEYLPAGAFILIDITANKVRQNQFSLEKGTQISVKASVGTGSIYLSTYYAE